MQDMPPLRGRRVVLGITGGVAAYKTPELVRRLRTAEAVVRVVLSRSARQFVAAGALAAVGAEVVEDHRGPGMVHIDLARWADAIVIAPATAHVLSRLAAGAADDLLTTMCLATEAPLCVAPAMNRIMWMNPATRANCALLAGRGVRFVGPDEGAQACGDNGPGRMSEPGEILGMLERLWGAGPLHGINTVVTAGPTYEALDPARGFTNRSSGKMGYALAAALANQGAAVTLISGPTALPAPAGVRRIAVTSARQMRDAVWACRGAMDLFVAAAAVADYRPQTVLADKLKKDADTLTVTLVRNPDILAEVAALTPRPFTVGFAAETGDVETKARAKRARKGIDLIVANPIDEAGVGFAGDDNRVILIDKDHAGAWAAAPKTEIARALVREIIKRLPRTASP